MTIQYERGTFVRTTLYKAIRLPDGRYVCVHPDHIQQTSKVVTNEADYLILIGQGWTDHPLTAMAQLEAAEDAISTDAAVRAFDDRHLSESAKAAAEQIESTTIRHLPEIPEQPKPGKRRKVVI